MNLAHGFRALTSLLLMGTTLGAQQPHEDVGFAPATPRPDPDLVVVRERAYGAGGVNLTSYGMGTPDYVQSIYFRFFVDTNAASLDSVAGRVVFPPQVQILGIITDGNQLGGAIDDGVATATDALFGIAVDPNDYSEGARGFETTGTGSAEFVCQTAPNAFVFGLNIGDGVDDFRVIVDYGSSFPTGLAFDVAAYDIGSLGGAALSPGFIVGQVGSGVLGSGDFGEVDAVLDLPLTASLSPHPSGPIPSNPPDNVYILRDTAGDTLVDHFDVVLQIPAPEQYSIPAATLGTPVGICAGPDNHLYVLGSGTGFAKLDLAAQSTTATTIADLAGSNVDLCGFDGLRSLYFLRDNGSTKWIDVFDVDALAFGPSFAVPSSAIGTPRGIVTATDGWLYAIGQAGALVRIDPLTGAYMSTALAPPTGSYVDLCASPSSATLYLVRDTAVDTLVDRRDLASGTTTFGFATTSAVGTPVGIAVGPYGDLYVVGAGSTGAPGFVQFDDATGAAILTNTCMDFPGSNVDIAFALPFIAPSYCTAKTNSQGCEPQISAIGVASVSSPLPFHVAASLVINNKAGILFYGFQPHAVPFQGGTLCVKQPVRRTPLQLSGGNPPPDDCSGAYAFDFNAHIDSGVDPLLTQGQIVFCQYWYRDPGDPLGFTTGLTTALRFTILP
ncbi:MAG: hypothetical protein IT454_10220 [Planctomycetes bacterium]|nr:hypothetical protein [Planctomycetota bacterium]